jgi:hypothetical protein
MCPIHRVATQVADELSDDSRHTFKVLSVIVARRDAVRWKTTEVTQLLCPFKVATQVATQVADELSADSRHNFAVVSSLPVARRGAVG